MSQYFPGYQQPYGQYQPPRYQQPMQSYLQQPMQPPMQPQPSNVIRVTGIEGAKAFPVAPSSQVVLFDDSRDVFYFKSTDSGGYPTLQACSFALLREDAPPAPDYVTRAEFDELKEMIANGKQPVRKAKQPDPAAE